MKHSYCIIAIFLCVQTYAQEFREYELTTAIKEVTAYLQGAQITRTGGSDIAGGKSELIIKSISPYIDEKSIQVKGEVDFTILGGC